MHESELHPYVEWIAQEARRPVVTDDASRERVMRAIHAEPLPARQRPLWHRFLAPRSYHRSPAASIALAAGLVGVGICAGLFANIRDGGTPAGQPSVVAARQLRVSDTVRTFVVVAPQAGTVSLVGDFNGWNVKATPMLHSPNGNVWTVRLPLSAGRHLYAFVVDSAWMSDPQAPLAPDDGFGHANSVILVSRGTTL
jgi:Glycogen recognition site of AMP-activated protein kinase